MNSEDANGLEELMPPTAQRVARRAAVLASCACRANLEDDPDKSRSRQTHADLIEWIAEVGVRDEFETTEWKAMMVDLGELPLQMKISLWWRSEGAVSLAWALKLIELPPHDRYVDISSLGSAIGLLNDDARHFLESPILRSRGELEWFADLTLAIHWRLREYKLRPHPLDFITFARQCQWASMPIDDLEIVERDLALRGRPISQVPYHVFGECLSIAQERHQAANWLIGTERVYSEVTTDT